jgi:hypothetical protein
MRFEALSFKDHHYSGRALVKWQSSLFLYRIVLRPLNRRKAGLLLNNASTDDSCLSNRLSTVMTNLEGNVVKLVIMTAEAFMKCLEQFHFG